MPIQSTGVIVAWFPVKERSIAFGLLNNGCGLGAMITAFIAGYVSEHQGWPVVYYICGAVGVASFFVFTPFVTSAPERHRFVTQQELLKIQSGRDELKSAAKQALPVPWVKIAKNKVLAAFYVYKLTSAFALFVIGVNLPTYMSDILHMPTSSIGSYFAYFNIIGFVGVIIFSWLSEVMIQRKWMSRVNVRKTFVLTCKYYVIAHSLTIVVHPAAIVMALCIFLIPYTGCDINLLIAGQFVANFSYGWLSATDTPCPSEVRNGGEV